MAETSGIILVGNLVPAIGVVGASHVAFNKGNKVNLANHTLGDSFRAGLYQITEKQEAHFNRRNCCRVTVHRVGDRDLGRPTFDVVVIDAD